MSDLRFCTSCSHRLTVDAFLKNSKDLTSRVLKTCCYCREKRGKAYHAKKDQGKKRHFSDELDANAQSEKRSRRINMKSEILLRSGYLTHL
jgi:hypothetical protein